MARGLNKTHEIFDGFLHLSWRPWRELSAIAMMLMELSWSVAWFQFFASPEFSLTLGKYSIFLGLWIGTAYSLARGLHFLRLQKNARRAVMLALFVVGVLALMKMFFYPDRLIRASTILVSINDAFKNAELILPVEIIVISFAAYLWNRGINLASVWINARYAAQRFRFGAIMLLALAIGTASRRVDGLTIGFTLYLTSSLLAIGASRASTIDLLRGGRTRLFDKRWFLSLILASTGVAALAWFLGNFATTEFGDFIVAVFFLVSRILLIVGLLVVSPLVFVLMLLFSIIDKRLQVSPLFQEIQRQIGLVIDQVTQILDGIGSALQGFWDSLPIQPFIKPLVLWLIVGLLLILVLRAAGLLPRFHVSRTAPSAKQDSVSESGAVNIWFRNMFGMKIDALSKRLSRLRRRGRIFGAMRVRIIYAKLMRLCDELGYPRQRVQTTLEFLPTLRMLFPNHFVEIALITETYNRVRYGELPEYRRDVQGVDKAWKRVREHARAMRQVQKHLNKKG